MKIKFTQEELEYFGGFLGYMAHISKESREARRRFSALCAKFEPAAQYVTLKQSQRNFLMRTSELLKTALKKKMETETDESLCLKIADEIKLTQCVFQKLAYGG